MADYKKPDYWQLKAQKENFPARSVYKLKEMDEKFRLVKPCPQGRRTEIPFRVLDLGAAPGSWSLYVLRKSPGAFLVSADLSPLSRRCDQGLFDGENFRFIQGDITAAAVREAILVHAPFGLIISDAAPATTGSRVIDAARSLELAEAVASYAECALEKGGSLVVKVFQGGDTTELLKQMRSRFTSAKSYKPEACRSESFEAYYLGLGKK